MKNIFTQICEFGLLVALLVAWHLVGKVNPSFGWFLSQPVVMITEIMVILGAGAHTIMNIITSNDQ